MNIHRCPDVRLVVTDIKWRKRRFRSALIISNASHCEDRFYEKDKMVGESKIESGKGELSFIKRIVKNALKTNWKFD